MESTPAPAPDHYELGEDVAAFADQYPPPDSVADIDRTMRILARLVDDVNALDDRAHAMHQDINEWHDETTAPLRTRIEYLNDVIADWMRATGTTKQVTTPYGVVRTRKGTNRLIIHDPEDVAPLLYESHPETVKMTVRLTEAKKVLALRTPLDPESGGTTDAVDPATGEILPNMLWENTGRTYSVTVK